MPLPNPDSADCISDTIAQLIDEGYDREQAIAIAEDHCNTKSQKMNRKYNCPTGPVHKSASVLEVGDREAVFIASTDTPDRHGDIVRQVWDFKDFRKNPIFQFQHDSSELTLPIGKVPKVWTEDNKTYALTRATPEGMDEFADKIWRFIKEGFLNAVSVGFLPIDPPEERFDKKTGEWLGWIFPKNALLELSLVKVPAQPEALAIAKEFNCTQDDVDRIFIKPRGMSAEVKFAKRYVDIERSRVRYL